MACFGCFGVSSDYAPPRRMLPPLGTPHPVRHIGMGNPTNTSRGSYPPLRTLRTRQPIGDPIHDDQIQVSDPNDKFKKEEKEQLVQRMKDVHTFFYDKFGIEAVTREQPFPQIQWISAENAYWTGKSGWRFGNRWITVETVAHEYIHAIVQRVANLGNHPEQKALNEALADAFASIFKQHENRQTVSQADWLLTKVDGSSYRSLKTLPAAKYPTLAGEEHADAAIANYAFYYAATKIGGNSWDTIGKIWCEAMKNTKSSDGYLMFFAHTLNATTKLYPQHIQIMREAWLQVGLEFKLEKPKKEKPLI